MRLAVISMPVSAAAGVAARSLQVTSPSKMLRPMVQMATGAACEAHQLQSSTTSVPAKGNTASNTSLDCQVSLFSATLHRIPWAAPANKRAAETDNHSLLHASQESEGAGARIYPPG